MSVDDALRGGSLSASFLHWHRPDAAVSSTTSHSTAALQGPSSASSSIPQQSTSKSSHAQQFPSNPHSNNSDILDLPDLDDLARNELLRGDVFPEWRDDSGGDMGLEVLRNYKRRILWGPRYGSSMLAPRRGCPTRSVWKTSPGE